MVLSTRPDTAAKPDDSRGSGPGAEDNKRRVVYRLPEDLFKDLKRIATEEDTSIQAILDEVVLPHIGELKKKHGL